MDALNTNPRRLQPFFLHQNSQLIFLIFIRRIRACKFHHRIDSTFSIVAIDPLAHTRLKLRSHMIPGEFPALIFTIADRHMIRTHNNRVCETNAAVSRVDAATRSAHSHNRYREFAYWYRDHLTVPGKTYPSAVPVRGEKNDFGPSH